MRQVRHIFSDNREAQAFICGVNWVNDSALEAIDALVGTDEDGSLIATVMVIDEEGDDDAEFDHRSCI